MDAVRNVDELYQKRIGMSFSAGKVIRKGRGEYLQCLEQENDYVEIMLQAETEGFYDLLITHCTGEKSFQNILVDGMYIGGIVLPAVSEDTVVNAELIYLERGVHKFTLCRNWGSVLIASLRLEKSKIHPRGNNPAFTLSNPNAAPECRRLMEHLKHIYRKKIITGQHTDYSLADVDYIERKTGKRPALLGFDLLSYSGSTQTEPASWDCMHEVSCCQNNVEQALRSVRETGSLLTLCWHWFSPAKGRDKSFYTVNSDYNLAEALEEKGEDYDLLIRDLDLIAEQLKRFQEEHIPVLWRPLHEADGKWFWWGAAGSEAYKKLYRLMYKRFTELHGLNNLIWVFNAPCEGWYPGDDVVDLCCMDIYAPKGNTGVMELEFQRGLAIPDTDKPLGLGEVGTVPNLKLAMKKAPWLWFMLWGGFTHQEESNKIQDLKDSFCSEYAITLEDVKQWEI